MSNLPHNPETERSLLSCFLQAERAIEEAGDIRLDDFLIPLHRAVFEAIRDLRATRRPVDLVTVGDEMTRRGTMAMFGGDSLIAIANHVPIWHGVRHWAGLVARDGTLRRVMSSCSEILARAPGAEDADTLVSEARRMFTDLETRRDGGPVRLGDRIDEVLVQLREKAKDPEGYRVRTGISKFDAVMGGFRSPQLIVVAARPGIGKTAFAGGVSLQAALNGIPALVFSLEMSFAEIAERVIGSHADFAVEKLHRGDLTEKELATLAAKSLRLHDIPLFIDDRVMNIAQLSATARSWRVRRPSKQALVVIDYLGLIRSERRAENRNLEVGAMAKSAKLLAKDLECPVVLVAQLNRAMEKEGREPMLSDLRDSGEIEAHADMVVFPHREQPLDQSGPASLIVPKNRGGVTGKIPCWWHAQQMTFTGLGVDENGRGS
jgi:replicative DNA helicase